MAETNLVAARGVVKAKLTRIVNFVNGFKDISKIQHLKARKLLLEAVFKEFEEVQSKIELTDNSSAALDAQAKERETFENQYCEVVANIEIILENFNRPASSNAEGSNNSNLSQLNIKLPTLNLPSFSGRYSEWLSFHDTFNSLIHENESLNDVQKMHYLKSSLIGDALRTIESLTISNANYVSAWEILNKRYKHKRLIVQEHVLSITNSSNINKATPVAIRQFINNVTANIEALRVLELPTQQWDALIVPLLTEKLDYVSKKEWYATLNEEIPKLSEFLEFLDKRCQILESVENINKPEHFKPNFKATFTRGQQPTAPRANSFVTTNKPYCFICKRVNHFINQCSIFLRLNVEERVQKIDSFRLCRNCFKNNHSTGDCRSDLKCRECNEKHSSLLHRETITPQISETPPAVNCCVAQINTVFLSTAIVGVRNSKNQFQNCRVLLDVGAQSNFITRDACVRLGLKSSNTNIIVSGLGQQEGKVTSMTTATIKSRINQFSIKVPLLIIPKITDPLPNFTVGIKQVIVPHNIQLADPNFCVRGPIDMLFGASIFWQLLCAGQLHLSRSQPYFQKTHLGWIVGGAITDSICNKVVANLTTNQQILEERITRFFEIEDDYSSKKSLSIEERACDDHFRQFSKRTPEGRFVVKLPFKDNHIQLGESKDIALKRFYALENKLQRNSELKLEYSNFMKEYISLGHMELVPPGEISNINSCYLPHHSVYKISSNSKSVRVVFDASCQTSNGFSLNDNLMTGPTIQQDLFSILIRFRLTQYVVNADITKMYRQIRIDKQDAEYQRIIYRQDKNQPLEIYRLLTVTYGMKPSAFLAVRCLHELALQAKSKYPLASRAIIEDFYMDDLLSGANSITDAIKLKEQVDNILLSAGFQLCKWASNSPVIVANARGSVVNPSVALAADKDNKTLGLFWNCQKDSLKYNFELVTDVKKVTKRSILGTASQLFDPLGLISAVTIKAKILIQQLWSLKLAWDESVPLSIYTAWQQFMANLALLRELKSCRKAILQWPLIDIQLHGFSDSSEQAYGAVIYIRVKNGNGSYSTNVLCAKARVAPLKATSLPRLELAGALLLAQLVNKVRQASNVSFNAEYYWTDSTIVLAWLNSPSNAWKTFVANRVAEIQSLTEIKNWRHIKGQENPADILSRGSYPGQLINNTLWFHGPHWLRVAEEQWPKSKFAKYEETLEKRPPIVLLGQTTVENELLDSLQKYSSFAKIENVVAYCLRFIHNCKYRSNRKTGGLSIREMQAANKRIILMVQRSFYVADNQELQGKGYVKNKSTLKPLDPFLDEQNLLRVGGRLKNANFQYDRKFPLILPPKHYVTKLIVRAEHERQLHAGPLATLASLRQKYWIISGRNLIRSVTRNCVKCFKVNPKNINQKMGNLPKERLQPLRPFLKSGVDFAGPILIKNVTGRSKTKAYIALFVCFATKAVHLELVGDLTTQSFINAFKRFISRRGHVSEIFCDNAKNFIGAEREFKKLFRLEQLNDKLTAEFKQSCITFHFIAPRAPHMGGLWESSIKAAKFHLKRILRDACVTYEELYTLLTRIEATLNSRPITPISNDPNDMQALTPGHFLIGETLTAPLEENLTEVKVNRLSRWQRIEQLRQHFWRRWSKEYLSQLQTRTKWQHQPVEIQIGSMVVVKEDGLPPLHWKLGRIIEVHPGSDNVTRVVSIKVANALIKRAINRVCFLPTE